MYKLLCAIITIVIMATLAGCDQPAKRTKAKGSDVMVTSVSSDGQFAITTNMNEHAYLWDLEHRTYKSLSNKPVNIYSAYFIRDSHHFMYQLNGSNEVVIQNTNGKIIKTFNPGFPSYGQVITQDLQNYFAADENLNMFKLSVNKQSLKQLTVSWCQGDHKGEQYHGPLPTLCTSFGGYGKLLNLAFTPSEKKLIGTGDSTLWVWDVATGKAKMVEETNDQTVNAISPDGKYVVVGDQQMMGYLYDLQHSKIIPNDNDERFFFDAPEDLPTVKNYFNDWHRNFINQVTALRFIDKDHFIVSYNGAPRPFTFLGLYRVGDYWKEKTHNDFVFNAKLTKYLPISKEILKSADDPYPETRSFVRDQAMDTSPSAHVLVMGQANGGGIMVYRYDPESQELKLDWAPILIPEEKAEKLPWYKRWFL